MALAFLPRLSNFVVYNDVCSCSKTARHSSSLTQKSLKHLCKDSLYMLTQHSRCYLQVQKKKLKNRGPKTEQVGVFLKKPGNLTSVHPKPRVDPFLGVHNHPLNFIIASLKITLAKVVIITQFQYYILTLYSNVMLTVCLIINK